MISRMFGVTRVRTSPALPTWNQVYKISSDSGHAAYDDCTQLRPPRLDGIRTFLLIALNLNLFIIILLALTLFLESVFVFKEKNTSRQENLFLNMCNLILRNLIF